MFCEIWLNRRNRTSRYIIPERALRISICQQNTSASHGNQFLRQQAAPGAYSSCGSSRNAPVLSEVFHELSICCAFREAEACCQRNYMRRVPPAALKIDSREPLPDVSLFTIPPPWYSKALTAPPSNFLWWKYRKEPKQR